MKNILIILSIIPLMSCGLKKELATANESNETLRAKVRELERENAIDQKSLKKCSEMNAKIYKENKEFAKRINMLQGGSSENDVDTEEVFTTVEVMPEFPGGQSRMFSFIARKVRYPDLAKENNVQGKVYVQFTVNKDGSISDAKVMRGIGSGCDEEALKAVNAMPNWIPGEQKGKPVRVRFNLPISFQLR